MTYIDHQYINTLRRLHAKGTQVYPDRTGHGRIKEFTNHSTYDLSKGFPFDTTRKLYFKTMVKEMLSFIHGRVDSENLGKIWDKWKVTPEKAREFIHKYIHEDDIATLGEEKVFQQTGISQVIGTIGPMYGYIWRNAPEGNRPPMAPMREFKDLPKDKVALARFAFEQAKAEHPEVDEEAFQLATVMQYHSTYDQLWECFLTLRDDPFSSRAIVSAYLPQFMPFAGVSPQENAIMGRGSLAPCHLFFQFLCEKNAEGETVLNCHMTQRSCDTIIGKCYNVAQYSLLTHMFAQLLGYKVGTMSHFAVDSHIYANHLEGLDEQITREPRPFPTLWINPEVKDLFDFTVDDFRLDGYDPHPHIEYPVAE